MICRSKIEEPYTEKEELLQAAEELRTEFNHIEKQRKSRLMGMEARLTASENLSETSTEIEPGVCMPGVSLCAINFLSLNLIFLLNRHYYSNIYIL